MGIYLSLCYKKTALTGNDDDYEHEYISCGKLSYYGLVESKFSKEFDNLYDGSALEQIRSDPVKMLKEWEQYLEEVLYFLLTHTKESCKYFTGCQSPAPSKQEVLDEWYYPYLEGVMYDLDETRKAIKEARKYKKLGYSVWASLG